MAMRLARSNDIWRALSKAGRKTAITQLKLDYIERQGGPKLSLHLQGPICLLCGENGVGKSTALKAIAASLGGATSTTILPTTTDRPPHVISISADIRTQLLDEIINKPVLSAEVLKCADPTAVASYLADSEGESTVYWYDPTIQIPYLLQLLKNDANIADLWSGVDPQNLTSSDLADVSALVGRDYSEVQIFEIGDYQNHPVIPYFRVVCNGVGYGSEEMGLGELSLLFAFWTILRLPFAAILLLEEPETFIAPHAQRSLIDYVAYAADEKSLFVVASSHSPVITERIPTNAITYVGRRGAEVTFLTPAPRKILIDRLGLRPPRSLLLVVEDDASAFLAKSLLDVGNSKFARHLGICIAGSDGEIASALKLLRPSGDLHVKVIGLFDGDQRGKLPKDLPWPVMCLPGTEPPELFSSGLFKTSAQEVATILGRPPALVNVAIASAGGLNHHDWIKSLCASLNISPDEYFYRIAVEYFAQFAAAQGFIHEIESCAR